MRTLALLLPWCLSLAADPIPTDAVETARALYRDLHTKAEVAFHETRTAATVAAALRQAGLEVTEAVGRTGVVGVLANGPGKTVLLRAELDGLPVVEASGLAWSAVPAPGAEPAMHACGHDVHLAAMITAAGLLARNRSSWSGTLVVVAQPAEEIGRGSKAMLDDGLYRRFPRPDAVLALHCNSLIAAGDVALRAGPTLANVDTATITVRSKGGHGASPQRTLDPVLLAARIVTGLQPIVSRETAPGTPAVITVGSIHGGTKANVIPDEVVMQATVRSRDGAERDRLRAAIERTVRGEAIAAGAPDDLSPTVTWKDDFTPSLHNDAGLISRLDGVYRARFGAAHIKPRDFSTGGDDCARLAEDGIPLAYVFIGSTDPAELAAGKAPISHAPSHRITEDPTLATAIAVFVDGARELLQ